MLTHDEAMGICDAVLAAAGADAEVTLSAGRTALLRYADNQAVQHTDAEDLALHLRLRDGARFGEARVQGGDAAAIARLAAEAQRQLTLLPPDPDPLTSVGTQPLLAVTAYHADAALDRFDATSRADAAEAMIRPALEGGLKAAGACTNSESLIAKATTHGMRGSYASTAVELSVTATAADSTGNAVTWSRSAEVLDPAAMGASAAEVAQRARHPRALEPGSYRAVLSASAVATILHFVGSGFNARSVAEGRSYLCGKVGQPVFGDNVHLTQDVTHPCLQGQPFDDDGLGLRRVELVRSGVADSLLHDRRTAAEAGVEPTGYSGGGRVLYGAFASALVMNGDGASEEDLLAACGDGVYVSRLWYTNWVDPALCVITGMTRDGTFRIRDGKLAEPVCNMRIQQNVPALLSSVLALGPAEVHDGVVAPALAAGEFGFNSATSF
ncbi:MAG: TldD/PmbA family protein [Armatimonadetes bacterium]|nr:TldD/PmbA family protein [Armatimonadota bacterium]